MKLAIMQPYLFPYLGYFQLIRAVDIFSYSANTARCVARDQSNF